MQRRLVPVAVALLAVAAFAVAAGSLDTVATDGPQLESPEGSLDDVDERAGGSRAGGSGSDGPDCQNCPDEVTLRSLLADWLPTVPPPVVLLGATIGCGLLALIARGGAGAGEQSAGTAGDAAEPPRPGDDRDPTTYATGDSPADRPVFRAWRDTLGRIEADRPGGTTPAECAEIARERGWNADSVATLTALFRRARYGGEIDDADARRARTAADRLEDDR